ncbi:hypothetical protein CUN91_00610 [Candidatus Carsonella ruddii]|uniref:Uncharacterized protein n=1 Tax=Carsonella ruddii TaxID=114186 RepID=A0A2K8KC16_CARRU|nr:hypothetical protein [Candidatus Carsonella ruddii]ATX33456.1 hypothetical protein CUN91_00610 [Candidatus Carsonella ruddii]
MQFFLKNKFIYGDSCSGKTYIYKKIKLNKFDTDYYLKYKKIILKYEFFFRIIEIKILLLIFKLKKYFFLGGGLIVKNCFLIYKNNSIIDQKKRLILNNFNRPTLKNNIFLKIRFCIRKKFYIKIYNICITKCLKCNILLL